MKMEKLVLDVKGMSCMHCVNAVKRALGSLDGVKQADVVLATGKATVEYDPAKVSAEDMKKAISEEGYTVA